MSHDPTTKRLRQLSELVNGQLADLVNQNADGIAEAIADAEDGKLGVSLSVKLQLVTDRLFSKSQLVYGLRRKMAVDDSIKWDSNQQPLPMEVEE
jgi:hypothetical protein